MRRISFISLLFVVLTMFVGFNNSAKASDKLGDLVVFLAFDGDNLKHVPNDMNPSRGDAYMWGWVSPGVGIRGGSADFINQKGFFVSYIPDEWLFSKRGVSIGMYVYSRGLNKDAILFSSKFLKIRGSVVPDQLEIEVDSNTDNREIIDIPQSLPKGKWTHITVTISPSGVEVFFDGMKILTDEYTIESLNRDNDPINEKVFIGGLKGKNGFDGEIDEFVVLSKKADEKDIKWLL